MGSSPKIRRDFRQRKRTIHSVRRVAALPIAIYTNGALLLGAGVTSYITRDCLVSRQIIGAIERSAAKAPAKALFHEIPVEVATDMGVVNPVGERQIQYMLEKDGLIYNWYI